LHKISDRTFSRISLRRRTGRECPRAEKTFFLWRVSGRRQVGAQMLESETIDRVRVSSSAEFVLARHDDDWIVRVDGRVLISSRMHHSEEALAEHAIERSVDPQAVLVGGLGLGFTLRAVLDRVSLDAKVTVAELVPALVGWNRVHLGALNDHPLNDPRVDVIVGDVFEAIKRSPRTFDVIVLDVDNGPVALSHPKNQRLYSERGVRACHLALRPHGVLAVWSAGPNARFERRLASAGFDVEVVRVAACEGSRARHVVFLAERRAANRESRASSSRERRY
jgi:spermidine synthase